MTIPELDQPDVRPTITKPRKPLRVWPGVIAAVVLVLARFVLPYVKLEFTLYGLLAMVVCVLAIVLWWLFFSRARWFERIGAVVLIGLALFATSRLVHISILTGSMGYLFPVLSVPILCVVLVAWAFITRGFSIGRPMAVVRRYGCPRL